MHLTINVVYPKNSGVQSPQLELDVDGKEMFLPQLKELINQKINSNDYELAFLTKYGRYVNNLVNSEIAFYIENNDTLEAHMKKIGERYVGGKRNKKSKRQRNSKKNRKSRRRRV
jgi:hypothetical protein